MKSEIIREIVRSLTSGSRATIKGDDVSVVVEGPRERPSGFGFPAEVPEAPDKTRDLDHADVFELACDVLELGARLGVDGFRDDFWSSKVNEMTEAEYTPLLLSTIYSMVNSIMVLREEKPDWMALARRFEECSDNASPLASFIASENMRLGKDAVLATLVEATGAAPEVQEDRQTLSGHYSALWRAVAVEIAPMMSGQHSDVFLHSLSPVEPSDENTQQLAKAVATVKMATFRRKIKDARTATELKSKLAEAERALQDLKLEGRGVAESLKASVDRKGTAHTVTTIVDTIGSEALVSELWGDKEQRVKNPKVSVEVSSIEPDEPLDFDDFIRIRYCHGGERTIYGTLEAHHPFEGRTIYVSSNGLELMANGCIRVSGRLGGQ